MHKLVVKLDISTWAGISIGATHCYCKLHYYDKNGEYIQEEMMRVLTTEEAKDLNKKERDSGYLSGNNKRGDEYPGFWTYEDAIQGGIDYFTKHLSVDYQFLIQAPFASGTVGKCLWAKNKKDMKRINELYKRAKEIGFYDNPKHEKEMDKIDDEYLRITK